MHTLLSIVSKLNTYTQHMFNVIWDSYYTCLHIEWIPGCIQDAYGEKNEREKKDKRTKQKYKHIK